jgi:hypothetical protein
MNNQKSRYYAILAIALLAISAASLSISAVNAADLQATYAFIAVNPNPAGLGQQTYVFFFLSNLQASAGGTGGARFHGYTVTITRPDGSKDVRGPFTSDPVSSAFLQFSPDQLGNYSLVFSYPGETTPATTGPGGSSPETIFLPSTSPTITLTVVQNASPILTGNPAPTSYWTRPINGQNWNWGSVSNNWLMAAWDGSSRQFDQGSVYVPSASAPNSAHVLWTKPLTFGGITGGEYGSVQFTDGRSYEQFFKPPVIISGRLYYNSIGAEEPVTQMNYSSIICVDMKDGSTIFTIPNATLSFGQVYNYVSPNQAGSLAYLWETRAVAGVPTTWRMFDAWTGQFMLSIYNVPSGTTLLDNTFYGNSKTGPGDILVYSLNAATQTLTIWNSSKTIPTLANFVNGTSIGTNAWQWRPVNILGSALNAVGNSPNVFLYSVNNYTNTANAAGTASAVNGNFSALNTDGRQLITTLQDFPIGGSIIQVGYDNEVIVANGSAVVGTIFAMPYVRTFCAYDMNTGAKLWGPTTIDFSKQIPQNATLYYSNAISAARQVGPGDILPLWCKEAAAYYAWNIRTGQFVWGPSTKATNGFSLYNWESKLLTPDGYLYNWGYDGQIHAYNLTTGASLWAFSSGDAGLNTPYGTYPMYNGIVVTDGKLFLQTSDHGNGVTPLYQGEGLYAINYKTGAQIWNITGWFEQAAISDGKYVAHNCYDNQIYCFGKGPSSVTVTASPSIQTKGSAVMIQGTVSDISPGAKQKVASGEFNIVPLVSDTDQGTWMNYIYQQQAMPTHANGVTVRLYTIDSNHNQIDIGTTTSDLNGFYKFMWTPPNEGTYTIYASFDGSNSYYPSVAETGIGVAAAPSASVHPTTTPIVTPPVTGTPSAIVTATPTSAPSPTAQTPVALYVAIAAAIVIVAVIAAAVVLRRRK